MEDEAHLNKLFVRFIYVQKYEVADSTAVLRLAVPWNMELSYVHFYRRDDNWAVNIGFDERINAQITKVSKEGNREEVSGWIEFPDSFDDIYEDVFTICVVTDVTRHVQPSSKHDPWYTLDGFFENIYIGKNAEQPSVSGSVSAVIFPSLIAGAGLLVGLWYFIKKR